MNPTQCKHRAPVGDWCRLATNQKCKTLCSSGACPIASSQPSREPSTKPAALPAHLSQLLEQFKPTPRATPELVESRVQHLERSKQIALELAQPEPDAWMNTIPAEAFQDGTRLKRPPRAKPLFSEIEAQLERQLDEARDRVALDAFLLEQEAQQLVRLILTSEHRALLHQNIAGKKSAARIVEAILLLIARQHLQGNPAEYVACTATQIADLTGLSLSTINHTLSQGRKGNQGNPNLKRWFSWKSVYGGQEHGTNGRCVGTLFRVAFRPRDLSDPLPAPCARAAAFDVAKAHLLENCKTANPASNTSDSFDCKKPDETITFSTQQENAKPQPLCFGDASLQSLTPSQTTLKNNDCKPSKYRVQALRDQQAEARAYAAMDRLGDSDSSFGFWYGLFKKALEAKSKVNEVQIWAVISDAKDAQARGVVQRSVAAYAVGALVRAGVVQAARQHMVFGNLETIQI